MNRRALDIIGPEVAPGERVGWAGMSSFHGVALRSLPALVFGSLFAIVPVATEKAWPDDALGWLLVAGVKALFFFGGMANVYRALVDLSAVNRTAYAITDRRILIVRRPPCGHVQSVHPGAINAIEHRVRPDGSGSVFYRKDEAHGLEASGVVRSGFVGVQDVIGAVRALEQLKAGAAA